MAPVFVFCSSSEKRKQITKSATVSIVSRYVWALQRIYCAARYPSGSFGGTQSVQETLSFWRLRCERVALATQPPKELAVGAAKPPPHPATVGKDSRLVQRSPAQRPRASGHTMRRRA